MNVEVNDELIIAGVSRATERILLSDQFVDRIAEAIALRFELMTPAETAALLDVTTRTLGENHVAWGLDKSLHFGASNPRYFLSQVIDRARQKVVKGKRPKGEAEKGDVSRPLAHAA